MLFLLVLIELAFFNWTSTVVKLINLQMNRIAMQKSWS